MDGDKKGKIFQQTSQAGKLRGRNFETLIHKHEIISPRYCAALLYRRQAAVVAATVKMERQIMKNLNLISFLYQMK